jgi:RNA-directed DNA polymerase
MPSRSFFEVPDQSANVELLRSFTDDASLDYIRAFSERGVSPLVDEGSLAHLVGISPKLIFSMTLNPAKYYRKFQLKKKSGKTRIISAPKTYLKSVQWWILDNILNKVSFEDVVTGFVRGRGVVFNANVHFGSKHLYNTDLEEFFPNISSDKVFLLWKDFGYPDEVCKQLTNLCTLSDGLPQGAPTSPVLANLACRELDVRLSELSANMGIKYSRYADDMTFSSHSYIDADFKDRVNDIIRDCGFSENLKKRRFRGPGQRLEVTGIVINEVRQYPRAWRKRARAVFHQAKMRPDSDERRFNEISGYFGALSCLGLDVGHPLMVSGKQALDSMKNAFILEYKDVSAK